MNNRWNRNLWKELCRKDADRDGLAAAEASFCNCYKYRGRVLEMDILAASVPKRKSCRNTAAVTGSDRLRTSDRPFSSWVSRSGWSWCLCCAVSPWARSAASGIWNRRWWTTVCPFAGCCWSTSQKVLAKNNRLKRIIHFRNSVNATISEWSNQVFSTMIIIILKKNRAMI